MGKVKLTDLTFLISIRIDSPERMENLHLVLEFIKRRFDTNVVVLEADKKEQVSDPLIDKKIFIEDYEEFFYTTKYHNQLAKSCETPIIAIWDVDLLIPPAQVLEATTLIRSRKADFCIPYYGKVFKIDAVLKRLYIEKKDINLVFHNEEKQLLMYGHFSVGGAFITNRSTFLACGGANECIKGWGPDDAERCKRWEILGHSIFKISGPAFHLYHPSLKTSWYTSDAIKLQNIKEYLKICSFMPSQLNEYIHKLIDQDYMANI